MGETEAEPSECAAAYNSVIVLSKKVKTTSVVLGNRAASNKVLGAERNHFVITML